MLNENIKAIRKSKGLSQEELAIKLNVVRQTISKWEQGLSVPDSDMLISISEVLETPVSTLLGETSVKEMIRAGPKKGAQNQPRQPRSFQGTSEKEEKIQAESSTVSPWVSRK